MNMKTSELIRREALKYERYKDQLDQIEWVEVETFRREVELAFERINHEFPDIQFVSGDPYKNLSELTTDIMDNGVMLISTDNNNSKLLWGNLNLKFRAVHDYLHYLLQQPFDFKGELNVYKAQKFMHSTDIGRRILYSEIVLQAAYATHFGYFPSKQKVII